MILGGRRDPNIDKQWYDITENVPHVLKGQSNEIFDRQFFFLMRTYMG